MSTPEPPDEPTPPAQGWGQPVAGAPGYADRPEPRYGRYASNPQDPVAPAPGTPAEPAAGQGEPLGQGEPAPGPSGPSPQTGPRYGAGSPGDPQYGQHGHQEYGHPQYGQQTGSQQQYGQQPQYGGYGERQYGAPLGQDTYGAYATAAKPGIVPLRPLTLGEIFDGAFGAIRHNPRVMLGLPAVVIAIATVLGTFLGYALSGYVIPALPPELTGDQSLVDAFSTLISTFGLSVVLGLASPFVTGLLIGSIGQSVVGRRLSVAALWGQVKGRVWALLGFTILVAVAQVIVTGLYLLLVWGAAVVHPGLGVLAALFGGIGLLAIFLWFTVRTLLIPPALVLEGQGLWAAVGRGWRLSRGSFWRLFGIYLLAYIAVSVIAGVLSVPFALIGTFALEGGSTTAYLAITGLGTILTGVLSATFMAGVVCLLYIDIRMRREGLDVELTAAANTPDETWDT